MIVSGVTAEDEEMCLVRAGESVLLSWCLDEIGRHAGNELWRLSSGSTSDGAGSVEKGPVIAEFVHALTGAVLQVARRNRVMLVPPEETESGRPRKRIVLSENNELVLEPELEEPMCVSLEGTPARSGVNRVLKKPISSSGADLSAEHPPELANDGNLETYWLSRTSKVRKFSVSLILSLEALDTEQDDSGQVSGGQVSGGQVSGGQVSGGQASGGGQSSGRKAYSFVVEWQRPASVFSLAGSTDGVHWVAIQTVYGNRQMKSSVTLNPLIHTYPFYKLELSTASKIASGGARLYQYGIKEIAVNFYPLALTVEPCEEARAHGDTRQFFFLVAVERFDRDLMDQTHAMTSAYDDQINALATSLSRLEDLDDPSPAENSNATVSSPMTMDTCQALMEDLKATARDQKESIQRIQGYLDSSKSLAASHTYPDRCSDRSKVRAQLRRENSQSSIYVDTKGYFSLKPRCMTGGPRSRQASTPSIVRVLCPSLIDESGSQSSNVGISLWTNNIRPGFSYVASIKSRQDISDGCSSLGMIPVRLSSVSMDFVAQLIQSTHVCAGLRPIFIPLAYAQDVVGTSWKDFSDADVTEIVSKLAGVDPSGGRIALSEEPLFGYDCEKFVFQNWSNARFGGVVCSEEVLPIEPSAAAVVLCTDTFSDIAFNDGNIVSCANDCVPRYLQLKDVSFINSLITGNNKNGYSAESSICFAAYHGNAIERDQDYTLLQIRVSEGSVDAFTGTTSNGLTSNGNSSPGYGSYKVSLVRSPCAEPGSEKLVNRLAAISDPVPPVANYDSITDQAQLVAASLGGATEWVYSPRDSNMNQLAVKAVVGKQAETYDSINDARTKAILKTNEEALMAARGKVKPLEIAAMSIWRHLERVSLRAATLFTNLNYKLSAVMTGYEGSKSQLTLYQKKSARVHGYNSFKWDAGLYENFYHQFASVSIPESSPESSLTGGSLMEGSVGNFANNTTAGSPAQLSVTLNNFGTYSLEDFAALNLGSLDSSALSDTSVIAYSPNSQYGVPVIPCPDGSGGTTYMFVGVLLSLRDVAAYDGVFSAKFFLPRDSFSQARARIGVIGKMRNAENLLAAVIENVDGGRAAIYSVQAGRETLLGAVPWAPGWTENAWFELALRSRRDRFALFVRDFGSEPPSPYVHLLTVQSELHAGSGSLGVVTNLPNAFVVSDMRYQAGNCQLPDQKFSDSTSVQTGAVVRADHRLVAPPVCSRLYEDWQNPSRHWSHTGPGVWRVAAIEGKRAVQQRISHQEESALVLRSPRRCERGTLQFSYYSPCPATVTVRFHHWFLTLSPDRVAAGAATAAVTRASSTYEMPLESWIDVRLSVSDTLLVFNDSNGHKLQASAEATVPAPGDVASVPKQDLATAAPLPDAAAAPIQDMSAQDTSAAPPPAELETSSLQATAFPVQTASSQPSLPLAIGVAGCGGTSFAALSLSPALPQDVFANTLVLPSLAPPPMMLQKHRTRQVGKSLSDSGRPDPRLVDSGRSSGETELVDSRSSNWLSLLSNRFVRSDL
ncbi:LCCL domain protein [Gregarina niphandrodes]|uniref:LCCL domain protein n=1 Tax=Gregarina niphandrodes TaxID=110365 RepID=A0A023B1F7_GRENI|nr:LCCL domain protein [Gregarina niphandrodes]EZG47462.1 LCCL domain protein [Gregarina niphandrodes]|eukprot:XP_011132177.1 LCCL domain protein [Gregarina niphandrodes]